MKDKLKAYIKDKITEMQFERLNEREMGELSAFDTIYSRIDKKDLSEIEVDIKIAMAQLKNRPEDYAKGRYSGFLKMKNYTEVIKE